MSSARDNIASKPAATLLWHDYETFGSDPAQDFPAQFAAIRTDHALNRIGAPVSIYCQPPPDYLPHPIACLITGLTPQSCLERGLPEHAFAARVHAEMAAANTTAVGFNSMRFDEEFTRQLLWRNFYPVYEREYKNGNARFDLIDVLRMAYALRPAGIHWPSVAGKPSFKLELLAQANGLSHRNAHDALSDVEVLIELARLLRSAQPKLFEHAFSLRRKATVLEFLDYTSATPLIHVSQRFATERGCLALWLPICAHPSRSNEIIGVDLAAPIESLLELDSDAIAERIFVRQLDLPEGERRIAIKTLHINRAPMLAPIGTLKGVALQRIALDPGAESPLELQLERAKALRGAPELAKKLRAVYQQQHDRSTLAQSADSTGLYSGFLGDADSALLGRLRAAEPRAFAAIAATFRDARLSALLFRYQARQFPDSLSAEQRAQWQQHCENQLTHAAPMTHSRLIEEVGAARGHALAAGKQDVLDALLAYRLTLPGC
jgi:exodeoxyribonuclease I